MNLRLKIQDGYVTDLFDLAASYIRSLTMNHPFIDGNKRTALATALVFLKINGYAVNEASEVELADKVLDFIEKKFTEKEFANINLMQKFLIYLLTTSLLILPVYALNTEESQTQTEKDLLTQEQIKVQAMLDQFVTSIGKDPKLYNILVQKSDQINAYATTGRRIVVFSALIESLGNDPALAFVVAHELGHIEENHMIHGMVRQGLIGLFRRFFLNKPKVIQVYDGVTFLGGLHYDRGSEKEADLFAVDLMNKLYCDQTGKLRFFENSLATQKESKFSEYFSTHPLSGTRLKYLREAIQEANCTI